jgi:uroporphyrinogen III methyltransferase/synthase
VTAADRPLADWRVLVTRPEGDTAGPFAEALAAAGATPVLYPTIAVAPPPSWELLDAAIDSSSQARLAGVHAHASGYGWAIFTSPSAVGFTLGRLAARGLTVEVLAGVRLAAVGTETARALDAAGLQGTLVPPADRQRQEGLLEALLAALPPPGAPGARILFPQALGGRELVRDELARRGYAVDVVPVSQTIALPLAEPPPAFDVATFASPSALRAFVERLGVERLAQALVAVIGPTTASAATALGVRVDAMPPNPSVPALVRCLIELRAARLGPRTSGEHS